MKFTATQISDILNGEIDGNPDEARLGENGRNNHRYDPHILAVHIGKMIGDVDVGDRRQKIGLPKDHRCEPVGKGPQEYYNGTRQITWSAQR